MFKKIILSCIISSIIPQILLSDDVYEPNNTKNTASSVVSGIYTLSAQNDDWFKIELYSGSVTITMTPASGDINMILYNSNNQIVSSNFNTGQEVINYNVVNSGTYYIYIQPISGSPTYTLDITTSTNVAWEKTLDFGPIRDVSVALYDIDNDGKDEIFIGTSKGMDSSFNEIRPAGLICLEDDGTVKWTRTFPAMSTTDNQTGKIYNTTSVSSAPFFANIDDDPEMEILIGVGGDTYGDAGPLVVGQPGDKGGIYALEDTGQIKWFHKSLDVIGGSSNIGDNRPDGVYGSPIVYDIDNDGAREVIYNGWDQRTWILNAKTGIAKNKTHLYDTIWSTPAIADINNDGEEEILVTADITANATVGTQTGGIFHVLTRNGTQNIPGFDTPLAKPEYKEVRGKFEDEALWCSPVIADIDNDGFLEIIYGTGNFVKAGHGEYIRVWNHDGTLKFKLPTIGRTFATPLVVDINNDGKLEIVTTTLDGYVYCWDNQGNRIFESYIDSNAIFSSPIAVDTNNDGKLEIIFASGAQITIVDYQGNKINTPLSYVTQFYKGSPAIKDIDDDGVLDLISGGCTSGTGKATERAVIHRWKLPGSSSSARVGKYQLLGTNTQVEKFVARFYQKVLNRTADISGLHDWTEKLVTGTYGGADIARGFIFSDEFKNRNTDDFTFITILYNAFFNRSPDQGGLDGWMGKLAASVSRFDVLDGFLYSAEFTNLSKSYGIKPIKEVNTNSDIEAFVQRFYQEILLRTADEAGLNDWTNRLASGTSSGSDIARGFIFSTEFTNRNTDNTTYVTILYKAFFGRAPDTAGLNGWLNALSTGTNRASVLDGFLYSTEFSNLASAYGIIAVK